MNFALKNVYLDFLIYLIFLKKINLSSCSIHKFELKTKRMFKYLHIILQNFIKKKSRHYFKSAIYIFMFFMVS